MTWSGRPSTSGFRNTTASKRAWKRTNSPQDESAVVDMTAPLKTSSMQEPAGVSQLVEHLFRREAAKMVATLTRIFGIEHLNLAEDAYPSLATGTNAIDVIFCRNVLMYFTPAQTRKVIGNLYRALMDGGWLAVSPSEASQALFTQFVALNCPGVILYQKSDAGPRASQLPWVPRPPPPPPPSAAATVLEAPPAPRERPPPLEPCPAPRAVAASSCASANSRGGATVKSPCRDKKARTWSPFSS